MQRKYLILILATALALLAGAAVAYYAVQKSRTVEQTPVNEHPTDSYVVFESDTPAADTTVLGRWQNDDNPQWFKVYYDDYDGDGFYWGKEWNESEDVQEYDLNYHGNGWFRWHSDGKQLIEMHVMDVQSVVVPKVWNISKHSTTDILVLTNPDNPAQSLRFGKVAEW